MVEDAPDALRFDAYRVVSELGRGATSVVYRVEKAFERAQIDPASGSGEFPALLVDEASPAPLSAAVKVINFADASTKLSRRFRKLFATEAWVATRLDHPNITKVHGWKVEDERAWLIMDHLEGHPLDQHISMDKLLPVQQVIDIMHKVAVALDYAHGRGVVNRDVKPGNVMLCDNGDVKVMDFGLALNTKKNVDMDSTYINGLGSPAYMSPEQIKGYTLNHQTDLYSLGVMFYQLLTGRLPFRAKNPASLIYKIINTEAVPVNQVRPELPEFAHTIIAKAMAKDLYSRYRRGADFARDLSDAPYQRVKADAAVSLDARWRALRGLPVLGGVDDIDVWELLRASTWRELPPAVRIMQEGSEGNSFGFVIEGNIELECGDRSILIAGRGELIGAADWLDGEFGAERVTSATTLDRVIYLEVNPSAFAYATEELAEEIKRIAIRSVVARLRALTQQARALSPQAIHPAPEPAPDVADQAGTQAAAAPASAPDDPLGWGVFASVDKKVDAAAPASEPVAAPPAPRTGPVQRTSTPSQTGIQKVVAHALPAAAAAAITGLAFNRTVPAQAAAEAQFNLDSSASTEFADAPLIIGGGSGHAGSFTDDGSTDAPTGGLATTEMAPLYSATTAFETSAMAPNFMSTTAMTDAGQFDAVGAGGAPAPKAEGGFDAGYTSEMAPNFSSTTAFAMPDSPPALPAPRSLAPAPASAEPEYDDMHTAEMAPDFSHTTAFEGAPAAAVPAQPAAASEPLKYSEELFPPIRF